MTLNKSGESRHHCLVRDLRRKTHSDSLLSIMLATVLLCMYAYMNVCIYFGR